VCGSARKTIARSTRAKLLYPVATKAEKQHIYSSQLIIYTVVKGGTLIYDSKKHENNVLK